MKNKDLEIKIKRVITLLFAVAALPLQAQPAADIILERVDLNISSENHIFESSMIIHGWRNSRTITSKTYAVGDKRSFTEYLSPPREEGTKMLKQGE